MKKYLFLSIAVVVSFSINAQDYEYKCEEAKFSILFGGKPSIKADNGLTDVMYEDVKNNCTYVASYKKSETDAEGKEYAKYIKKKIQENDDLILESSKEFKFRNGIALKAETVREKKYVTIVYETIYFKHNGYDIELICMSKEEYLDMNDAEKFAKSFKAL